MALAIELASEADTDRLGRVLADNLAPGTTVALEGTLGAGKTRLVQAIAGGLGIDPREVTSPTFVLYQRHAGSKTLHHYDVYRLKDEDEFLQLGPEESFHSEGITLVEWADKFPDCLPEEHLVIRLTPTSATGRQCELTASAPSLEPIVDRVAQAWLSRTASG
jgi:tRNA threonylcarbamoyladenosine biosynthesis protein TsaE